MRELLIYALQRCPRTCEPLLDARSGSLSAIAVEALAALYLSFAAPPIAGGCVDGRSCSTGG